MTLEFMLLEMKDNYNKLFAENWNLKYLSAKSPLMIRQKKETDMQNEFCVQLNVMQRYSFKSD